uniref:Tetraspanin n=1 Tax=Anabas testudineus TaxID=64144 RepID=A0AAQ6IAA4_ANATE
MCKEEGCCCNCMFTVLSVIFKAVGTGFASFGGWMKKNANSLENVGLNISLFNMFAGILIFQGSVMVAMGTVGIYRIWKQKGISLKMFCIPLAIMALVDVVFGVYLYFKCPELKTAVLKFYTSMYDQFKGVDTKDVATVLAAGALKVTHTVLFCCGLKGKPEEEGLQAVCQPGIMGSCRDAINYYSDILAWCVLGIFLATAVLLVRKTIYFCWFC